MDIQHVGHVIGKGFNLAGPDIALGKGPQPHDRRFSPSATPGDA